MSVNPLSLQKLPGCLSWLLALALLVVGCVETQTVTPRPVRLHIAGSSSMMPLLQALVEAFRLQHAGVEFSLEESDSAVGLVRVREGSADLAAVSWWGGSGNREELAVIPIGWDGIALIVHRDNPVSRVTSSEARAIFAGRLLDWAELGGAPAEILVVSREQGSGTRSAFEDQVMGTTRVTLTAVVMSSSQGVVEYVAGHPNAIGYVSHLYNRSSVKTLFFEGSLPTVTNLHNGRYLLRRPLYLVSQRPLAPQAQALVDFALSSKGQAVVARYAAPIVQQ